MISLVPFSNQLGGVTLALELSNGRWKAAAYTPKPTTTTTSSSSRERRRKRGRAPER